MKLNKKNFYFQVIFLYLFSFVNTFSIHHHPRLDSNLLKNTSFLGKNRVLILSSKDIEMSKLLKKYKNEECEIINRRIVVLLKKDNKYYNLSNNRQETIQKIILPHKVSLIGLDGNLKFVDDSFSSFKKYLNLIDEMPIRKKEIRFDIECTE